MQIQHDGSHNIIKANGTGNLILRQDTADADIVFKSDDGAGGSAEYFRVDGGATKVIASKNFAFLDSVKAEFGDSGDLQIYHDGANSFVADAGTGGLFVEGNSEIRLRKQGTTEIMAQFLADAEVRLYYNNSKKFETTNTGVTVTGDINLGDSSYLYIGASNDLQLIHDGTDSYIQNTQNSGDLIIQNGGNDKDVILNCDDGSGGTTAYLTLDGGDVSTILHTVKVLMPNLPTSDPSVAGQLYTDSGVLKVSAG